MFNFFLSDNLWNSRERGAIPLSEKRTKETQVKQIKKNLKNPGGHDKN